MRFSILNAVCMGTTHDQAWIVRESESLGSPSSHACLRVCVHGWTRWAGWPKLVRCDRGTHNRCAFSSILIENGLLIRPAGLEAPEQIGRVERRGAVPKKMMSKVIKDTHASGRESMDMILSECLNGINEMTRHGGFLPWYSGYSRVFHAILPPWVTKMNVSMWVFGKHMPMDQLLSGYGHVTEQRHVKRSYDGIVANGSDAKGRTCGWVLPSWRLSRIAEQHEQANTDCNGASFRD